MSDQKVRTLSTCKNRQSVESCQPAWMARWMPPSSYAATERRTLSACGNEELDCMSRDGDCLNASDVSLPDKGLGKVETKNFGAVKSLGSEMMCRSPMNNCRETVHKEALSPGFCQTLGRGKAIDWKARVQFSGSPAVNQASVNRCNSPGEGTSKSPPDWMKAHSSAKERSFAQSKLNHETIAGTSKHILLHNFAKSEFHEGKVAVSTLTMTPSDASENDLPNCNMIMLDREHCNQRSHSDLIFGRKMRSYKSKDTAFRGFNVSMLSDSPSTSDHILATDGHESFPTMQEHLGILVPPSQFIASEKTKTKKSCYNFFDLQKLPENYFQDMEANPEGFPRFSQTTHSLLITKKADANLSKEVFRTTQLITEINQNMSPEIHNLLPFSGHVNRGVKLESLSSSSHSEEKNNAIDVKPSKVAMNNESSAETDSMDLQIDEGNSNPGANYIPSTKVNFAHPRDPTHGWTNTGRPDINLELPPLPDVETTSEHACGNSSRTQSLEMDMLLAHAEQRKRKSTQFLVDSSEPDPITRWIKRLKTQSSSSYSQNTRNQILAENSSPDRMERYLKTILDRDIARSEPTPSTHPVKELDPFTAGSLKKNKAALVSHTWIKRWLQNGSQASQKMPETDIVSEPKSSKLIQHDIDNKQLPSIAAMALMGRALNCLQSCELQKKGSFTVWNTQGILKTP